MTSIHELCLARHSRSSDFLQKWGKRDGRTRRKETIRGMVHLTLHKLTWSILSLKKNNKKKRKKPNKNNNNNDNNKTPKKRETKER